MVNRNSRTPIDNPTRPTVYRAAAPDVPVSNATEQRPSEKAQPKKKRFTRGQLALMFAGLAVGTALWWQYSYKPHQQRQQLDQESVDRVTKLPTLEQAKKDPALANKRAVDIQIMTDRRAHMQSTAGFIDQHFSWKIVNPNAKPLQAEPTETIKQLGVLAGELGKSESYAEFVRSNRYRWIDADSALSKTGTLSNIKSDSAQNLTAQSILRSADRLFADLNTDDRFQRLVRDDARFSQVKTMLEGYGQAIQNFRIGISYDPLPGTVVGPKSKAPTAPPPPGIRP